ncbi:hypothetical protein EUX98_g4866 [Antrodiella citrinella]|uniref:Uncharacterized protein n=1 Tax=Antrodiella citrinella TaxID=2447956 RepID=A0A4S4MTU6_9APHY|nr:hypothetical protein EUX98_g4866 [Antrodiella citrinella]
MIVQTVINGTSCSRLEQLGWRRFWLSKLYHALYPPHRRMGSIGILDLTLIPESDRAIPIVNEWVRDVLNTVHDGVPPPSYLTTISEASHLAFAFDSSAAREYLPRTPFVNMPPSHALLLRENQYHVVHDLLQALDGSSPVSISAGILFFAHVCSQRLIIDISILCHILDWLCMSIVVAAKAQKSSSLHNITIPSSWISATRRDDHKGRDLNLRLVVLEQIRGLIAQAITSLVPSKLPNGFVPSLPSIYIRYVQAHDFHSLVKAMRHSEYRYGTSLDHLIQLKDQKLVDPSVPIYTPFATHTIVFNEQADIYKLLAERIPQESIPPMDWDPVAPALDQSVEHQAEESGQGRASLNEQDDEDEDADEDESDEEDLVGDHDLEEDQEYEVEPAQFDIAAATSLVNAANSLQSVAPPTSVEIDAAVTIQTAYRIHRWHRRAKRQGLDKTRDTWFLKCRQASQDLPSTYRRLFLGALPHILLCLENAVKHAQGVKKLAMLSLHEAEHDKYEVLKEAYDRAM